MPAESGEKRVELSIESDVAVLKLSSWVDGLGWCGEKTMHLEAEILDEVHKMIGAARIRLRNQRADAGEAVAAARTVLQFPQVA